MQQKEILEEVRNRIEKERKNRTGILDLSICGLAFILNWLLWSTM